MSKFTPGPYVIDLAKYGGDWRYEIRTEKPHNPAGGLGIHLATVNKHVRQAEANAALFAGASALYESLDPDALDAIADEIIGFEHSARCASLRGLAKRQREAIAKVDKPKPIERIM